VWDDPTALLGGDDDDDDDFRPQQSTKRGRGGKKKSEKKAGEAASEGSSVIAHPLLVALADIFFVSAGEPGQLNIQQTLPTESPQEQFYHQHNFSDVSMASSSLGSEMYVSSPFVESSDPGLAHASDVSSLYSNGRFRPGVDSDYLS